MSAQSASPSGVLPAQMPLLLFHAAGVALGAEAASVERILDAEQAREAGIACRGLVDPRGNPVEPSPAPEAALVLMGRDERCGIGIDSLDGIVTVPSTDLQPLPAPLSLFPGPRAVWGGIVREQKVVLLVDVDRLLQRAPAVHESL